MEKTTLFMGIVPRSARRPLVYAVLNAQQEIVQLARGDMGAIAAYVQAHAPALAAICGPPRPNQGLMTRAAVRQQLDPVPRANSWMNCRVAEYQLRQHKLPVRRTPAEANQCPAWMQTSFELRARLAAHGYQDFGAPETARQCFEVSADAAYAVLIEKRPLPKRSLEGRLQRQLILYDQGIEIDDPMRVFDQITRFRLKQGILPLKGLRKTAELDALIAALTARTAALHPEQVSLHGDAAEGQIVLPVAGLNRTYP